MCEMADHARARCAEGQFFCGVILFTPGTWRMLAQVRTSHHDNLLTNGERTGRRAGPDFLPSAPGRTGRPSARKAAQTRSRRSTSRGPDAALDRRRRPKASPARLRLRQSRSSPMTVRTRPSPSLSVEFSKENRGSLGLSRADRGRGLSASG